MATFPIPSLQLNPALISFSILAVYFIFGFLVGRFLSRYGTFLEVIYGTCAFFIGLLILRWLGMGNINFLGIQGSSFAFVFAILLVLFLAIGTRLKTIPKLEIIFTLLFAFLFWVFLTKSLTSIKWLPALGSGVRLPGQALVSTALNTGIPSVLRVHIAMTLLGLILGIILKPKKQTPPDWTRL